MGWEKRPDARRAYQNAFYRRPDQRAKRNAINREWRRRKRLRIYERDDFTCVYCCTRFEFKQLTIDHKYPQALGGSDDDSNKVTCCWSCNRRKGMKTYEQFMAIMQPDREPDWVTEIDWEMETSCAPA